MNRLVIIGNGFDLAHGLKTSYREFIGDFWKEEKEKVFCPFRALNRSDSSSGYPYKYEDNVVEICAKTYSVSDIDTSGDGYELFENINKSSNARAEIKNAFLKTISKETTLQNWVDIEEEYYREIKTCLDEKRKGGIEKLNKEFSEIKVALETYLEKISKASSSKSNISQHLKMAICDGTSSDSMIVLNFNYTDTINHYVESDDHVIHIHGKLKDSNNPIIFGYADELDEKHKSIENKNNNEYLKNIKSINYLKTKNYKRLQTFIESGEYEIFIMGHSCGISDRTLLNRLFEHKHCRSIRVFYHKKDDGSDNYDELVCNIYRIFNDKNAMIDKVISKEESVPLV